MELKPCPFCGSSDLSSGESLVSADQGYGKQTGCNTCGALGPVARITDDQVLGTDGDDLADAEWNRRLSAGNGGVAPTPDQAYEMGAKGAPATERERLLFANEPGKKPEQIGFDL